MTRQVRIVLLVLGDGEESRCTFCGVVTTCHPAGPGGEEVCWDCAHEHPAGLERYLHQLLQEGLTQ
jgi:hypothetical protein